MVLHYGVEPLRHVVSQRKASPKHFYSKRAADTTCNLRDHDMRFQHSVQFCHTLLDEFDSSALKLIVILKLVAVLRTEYVIGIRPALQDTTVIMDVMVIV